MASAIAVTAAAAPAGSRQHAPVATVASESQFHAAAWAMRRSGGTIRLLPNAYGELVVAPRFARPLRIVGRPGVRVQRVVFDRTQRVALERVTIAPRGGDALIELRASRHVALDRVTVTAHGTAYSASVLIPDSAYVTITRSRFSHCGDRSPKFVNCVLLHRWARHITVEDSWFHDCLGCDFIHGRFGSDLTIRGNRFERSLPCRIGRIRCGHQDLIELFAGRRLRVVGNHFGVYKVGGAQLYLTNDVDYVRIVNNVFIGTDARVPGYRSRVGLIVGSAGSRRLPYYVRVVNNTILTGAQRLDGYAGSVRMSSRYGGVPRGKRPVVVNNVIGLLRQPARVCNAARVWLANVVLRGRGCSPRDQAGPAHLDPRGRPTAASTQVIDRADRRFAPRNDARGRRRGRSPDIGAYEYGSR